MSNTLTTKITWRFYYIHCRVLCRELCRSFWRILLSHSNSRGSMWRWKASPIRHFRPALTQRNTQTTLQGKCATARKQVCQIKQLI